MKFGLIYKKWIMVEEEENNFKLVRKWKEKYDSKEISKKCYLCTQEYFLKNLNKIGNITWRDLYMFEFLKLKDIKKEISFYPKVSVILGVYNGEKTINNSVKSILKQSYKNIELIVIDDCSKDNTVKELEKFGTKIKLIKNKENMGVYYGRNLGIKNSTGDIIAIQDADDISDKNRIKYSVNELIKRNVEFVLANGKNINNLDCEISTIRVTMATLVCDKNFFNKYGYYDENTRHSADLEIFDRAYFLRYGEYKFKNFWYWLNYTSYEKDFYSHIYENLYYIGTDGERITKQNRIHKRINYLNRRRRMFLEEKNKDKSIVNK